MSRIESPHTLQQILTAFEQQDVESTAYWSAFDDDTFFRRIGESWSPAETVRHLNKSTRPVVKALGMPKIALRFLFGTAKRSELDYDGLVARYRSALDDGGQAGRFAPSSQSPDRDAIMRDFAQVNRSLRDTLSRWSDAKLDKLRLPHPLLGKLTIREMLFFTLYHHRHHLGVVQRRLRDTRGQ